MGKKMQITGFISLAVSLVILTVFIIWLQKPSSAEFHAMVSAYWSVYKPIILAWFIIFFFSIAIVFIFIPKILYRKLGMALNINSRELEPALQLLKDDPQAAIMKSFLILEDKLRKMTGNTKSKTNIRVVTNAAFGEQGLYTYTGDSAEDLSVKAFIDSAFTLFRNPNTHQLKDIDHDKAISVIVVVDTLLNIVTNSVYKK